MYSADRPEYGDNGSYPFVLLRYSTNAMPIVKLCKALSILWNYRQVDTVFFSGMAMLFLILPVAMVTRAKKVIILHGHEPRMLHSWRKSLFMYCCNRADYIVGVSNFAISTLKESSFNSRLKVIPNGIDISHRYLTKNQCSLPIKLITVGSVSLRKGQHNVIAAMSALSKEFPGLEYHIIGQRNENIIEQIKRTTDSSIMKSVFFHGVLSDSEKENWLNSPSIFVMLSENQPDGDVEGFGIAVLEANLRGMPAIGSAGTGLEQSVHHGTSGLLIDPKDHHALVSAIREIVSRYGEFSEGAVVWALQHDVKKMGESYEMLLKA